MFFVLYLRHTSIHGFKTDGQNKTSFYKGKLKNDALIMLGLDATLR